MRELMILCAKSNIVCRARKHGRVWLASPGAKQGFVVSVQDALSLVAHGPNMYTIALAQGLRPSM